MLTAMSTAKRSKSGARQFQESWTADVEFACRQRWARYSVFELIDIDTRYLKIELIDTDTIYFEEVLNRYRYQYSNRRYKYLDAISRKKSVKKIGLEMN